MNRSARFRHATLFAALALPFYVGRLASQPGFPPNEPDSWRVAGSAKIYCSALFVSRRQPEEARAHLTGYFLGPMIDSITRIEVDHGRKLVSLTVASRITRSAKYYGDQGCVIHQPGKDTVYFTPVKVTSTLPPASTMDWPMGDRLPNAPLPAEVDTAKLRQAVDAAFGTRRGADRCVRRRAQRAHHRRAVWEWRAQGHAARELVDGQEHHRHARGSPY